MSEKKSLLYRIFESFFEPCQMPSDCYYESMPKKKPTQRNEKIYETVCKPKGHKLELLQTYREETLVARHYECSQCKMDRWVLTQLDLFDDYELDAMSPPKKTVR